MPTELLYTFLISSRAAARGRGGNGRRFTARRMVEKNLYGTGRSTTRPSRPSKRQRIESKMLRNRILVVFTLSLSHTLMSAAGAAPILRSFSREVHSVFVIEAAVDLGAAVILWRDLEHGRTTFGRVRTTPWAVYTPTLWLLREYHTALPWLTGANLNNRQPQRTRAPRTYGPTGSQLLGIRRGFRGLYSALRAWAAELNVRQGTSEDLPLNRVDRS
ncbi:hypothetical protein B0H17DRAFT_1176036 [Mycena rosella]|uniref:Uncharacterized protein n=1 Tax=Mycena rosella TaxID=1033263 RepID=A0AAD7E115_MYCRO|nr:hypothetical protein B0H17DRAFT_1176036 [Mycena rosella]